VRRRGGIREELAVARIVWSPQVESARRPAGVSGSESRWPPVRRKLTLRVPVAVTARGAKLDRDGRVRALTRTRRPLSPVTSTRNAPLRNTVRWSLLTIRTEVAADAG
jgi:hypothetical protein